MSRVSNLIDDPDRLAALRQTRLLATPAEPAFDRVTRLAAKLLDAPVSLLTLVDVDHQFFKSCLGLAGPVALQRRTPLTYSFCQYVVQSQATLTVNDARSDALLCTNLAIPELGVIAYLGSPLKTADGYTIGALCVIDTVPRQWTSEHVEVLEDLAAIVSSEIEGRQAACDAAAAEEALRTAEEKSQHQFLEAVLDNTTDAIAACNESGKLMLFNRAARELHQLSEEPLFADAWAEHYRLMRPDGVTLMPMSELPLYRAFNGEVVRDVEMVVAPADGRPSRRFLASGRAFHDSSGKKLGAVIGMHDITERAEAERRFGLLFEQQKRDELALAESKHFAESIAEQSACFIYVRDIENDKMLYANREVVEFLGYSADHMLGTGLEFLKNIYHPDDFATILKARETIKSYADGQVLEYTARCKHACGEWRWLWNRQVVFRRHPDGRPSQIMGAAQDVTELLRTQEELKTAKETAEAATRIKSEFLANMSHEIRTPMTAILGYTNLLADPKQTARQRAGYIEIVRRNGEHLLQVLNDILDISKIEAGKFALELIECNPAEILDEVKMLVAPLAAEKKLAFDVEQGENIPGSIVTDSTRVKQILLNLVGNAIKFTDQGSVRLLLNTEIIDGISKLRFDVVDTGIGLSDEQKSRLFNPFSQADASMTRRYGGSGLGLAICRSITAMLGGEMSLRSEPGQGSTFTVWLNFAGPNNHLQDESVRPGDGHAEAFSQQELGGRRVLVAEDSADTRRLVTYFLESFGVLVETATDGKVAVDAVVAAASAGRPFDAVLMDMQMPVLDGYRASAKLREMGFDQLPIIAFTAHALATDRQQCISAGCNDYVSKPIEQKQLLKVLSTHLKRGKSPLYQSGSEVLRSNRSHEKVVGRILGEYIEGLPHQVTDISAALSAGDLSRLQTLVHQLKGTGGCYGFPKITQDAARVEDLIRSGAPGNQVTAQVGDLINLLRRVEGYDRGHEE